MQLQGKALRVCIYVGESDHYRNRPLYMALLEYLRGEDAAGATVTRGLAGFGAHSRIHTATVVTLSADLPIKLEWVDTPQRVERLLPQVRQMVADGLITIDEVDVVQYAAGRVADPLDQPVSQVMHRQIFTVQPDLPVDQIVALLLHKGYRALPVVVGDGRLVGIITDGDLLRRAGLHARLALQNTLSATQMQDQLAELESSDLRAADIMTQNVMTMLAGQSVRVAVTRMAGHELKRLPVLDESGRLVGLVSRVDILRSLAYHGQGVSAPTVPARTGTTIEELMYRDVPTVEPGAKLAEIVAALETDQRRRAVVVDGRGRVLGIITDGDLLRRSRHGQHPTLLSRLRGLISGSSPRERLLPDAGETAAHLMTAPAITIMTDTTLDVAMGLMLSHNIKRLPVVDETGKLVGLLGRASLLNGLLHRMPPDDRDI